MPWDAVVLDYFADDDFGGPVAVDVGGVPAVEAAVVGGFEEGQRGGFVEDLGLPAGVAERHGAEDGDGDAEAGAPELAVGCFGEGVGV